VNKKIIFWIIIVLLVGVGGYWYLRMQIPKSPQTRNAIVTTATSSVGVPVYPFTMIDSNTDAHAEVGSTTYEYDYDNNTWSLAEITTSSPRVHGLANVNFAGITEAQSLSPDDRYFAFETIDRVNSSSVQFALYAINTVSGANSIVPFPSTSSNPMAIPYIESFSWNKDDMLNVVFYFISGSGDDNYHRVTSPELWQYNLATQQFADLGPTQSQQPQFASSCGGENPLINESAYNEVNVATNTSFESIPVYQISPAKLIGVNPNAADNTNLNQETFCDGMRIEQQDHQYSIYDSSDNLLGQTKQFWGMFIDPVSVFQYNNKDYFVFGGGDCGNQYCNYDYDLASVDATDKMTSITGNTTENGTIFSTFNLWSAQNPVGEGVYAESGNLYIITGDGEYPEAIVVNASDTYVMTVLGGATSTDPANSVPPEIQKLLLARRG
jgi:hypothetical protein